MVFRCPTCGRFIKSDLHEGGSHLGTCKKCDIIYLARFSGCINETDGYDAWLTVWPSPVNSEKGKSKTWKLNVNL